MVAAEAGQPGPPALEVLLEEPEAEVGEVRAAQRRGARVGGRQRDVEVGPGRQHGRQGVPAVVADEDAPRARPVGEHPAEVLQPLVEGEEVVGRALAEEHRHVEPTALPQVPLGAVAVEEVVEVRRHVAGRGRLDEALHHPRREGVGRQRGRGQRRRPLRARHALREQALGQAEPGDLGDQRVEAGRPAVADLAERPDELVAAAVGPADRAEHRVARPLLLHPRLGGDEVDDRLDVLALHVGVLDVGLAAALAEAALVEAQHAEPGVRQVGERSGIRRTTAAPAVAVQHHRHRTVLRGARRPEEREADVDRRRGARVRDALQAAVGRGDRACRSGRRADERCGRGREQAGDGGGEESGGGSVQQRGHGISPATGVTGTNEQAVGGLRRAAFSPAGRPSAPRAPWRGRRAAPSPSAAHARRGSARSTPAPRPRSARHRAPR